ncbi:methyl-accepting chemotaxis protein [Pseudomonas sp. LRF_L74]|uniref:methyl-accepting chemotaxis protein n=1 Tax=Pseudomonas sp. LRF_L74 TaxID=3369422 RepID=UPI003F5D793C
MVLRRMNIAPRAIAGFSLIALLVLLLGLFAMSQMRSIRGATVELTEDTLPSYAALGTINEKMLRLRIVSFRLLVDREPALLDATLARGAELTAQLKKVQADYESIVSEGAERTQYEQFKQVLAEYLVLNDKLVQLSRANDMEGMRTLLGGEYKARSDAMGAMLDKLIQVNRESGEKAARDATSEYDYSMNVVLLFMLLAAALTATLALLLTRSIVLPLRQAVQVAQVVASGDLTENIRVDGRDEPARLLDSLRTMQQSLKSTLQSIAHSSSQLASAAEELNAVTEDSSRGLHQQNNEIEQAATAVNEMTTAVDEVAHNAVATSEASRDSDRTAREGQEQVNRTVDAIGQLAEDVTTTSTQVEQLAEKVHDISKVLDVIRTIAEQTNLLALNAAIEAARAGEQGRGFAVVADEVRALAHRTQQSTQEIEQMIGGIQQGTDLAMGSMRASNERARSTLELARAAGVALQKITEAISHITERNLVIASASEEQAQVAREVDRNLVNIRDLALQTSAGANQTNAASQELSRLAIDLNTLVTRFTI